MASLTTINNEPTIAIIGAGNMGQAIINGLRKSNYPPHKLWLTNPDLHKLQHLGYDAPLNLSTDNAAAVTHADIVILAVKPQIVIKVIQDLMPQLCKNQITLISLAAGISIEQLNNHLHTAVTVIRAMPNLASAVCTGITALYAQSNLAPASKNVINTIFEKLGITVWLEQEQELDCITAISGSGPAYFFVLIEAMIATGEKLGLTKQLSSLLAHYTARGVGNLVTKSNLDATQWRNKVTSPNGTTAAALNILTAGGIEKLIEQAIIAAYNRAQELKQLT